VDGWETHAGLSILSRYMDHQTGAALGQEVRLTIPT
jgi:hypothetical protein